MGVSIAWKKRRFLRVYTDAQAARKLGISEQDLMEYVNQGKLRCAKLGSFRRFTDDDFRCFLRSAGSSARFSRNSAKTVAIALTAVLGLAAFAGNSKVITQGAPLLSHMSWNPLVKTPPLNSPVTFSRRITPDLDPELKPGFTANNLALVMEVDKEGNNGYKPTPWPLYIQLTSNIDGSPGGAGDQVGSNVVLRTSGAAWGTGYHVEVHQAGDHSTNIGYNAEMHKLGSARNIGVNIQASCNGPSKPCEWGNQAINIQSGKRGGWDSGLNFNGSQTHTGIHFDGDSNGERAIWVQGKFGVGLDLGGNPLRMNAGTAIGLEPTGAISISFNPKLRRIEFKNGDSLLGYINADTASAKRMN